ncbi:uncharacterized protein LY79DRAFT_11647 [Colletotrichum navitas]|uniref:Transmembrane protein n=1 Tax=Colletotrichum navitas TaxID=681940 RepID=A0AAD8VAB7_9PEZI|nr:uncharacterized protein LY79DRAFT_11647 [Colletotrichum navitas]KAK1600227.1 hypothetical protein LY79DRAFT_11647 [Colletotrichum navitas]
MGWERRGWDASAYKVSELPRRKGEEGGRRVQHRCKFAPNVRRHRTTVKQACILDSGQRLTHTKSSPSLLALCLRSRFCFFSCFIWKKLFLFKIFLLLSKYHGPACSSAFGSRLRMLLPRLRALATPLRAGLIFKGSARRRPIYPVVPVVSALVLYHLVRARGIARVRFRRDTRCV